MLVVRLNVLSSYRLVIVIMYYLLLVIVINFSLAFSCC